MDEDEWRAQGQDEGYYGYDIEESDPDQANLLAEKIEAVHAPMPKKKSSPKKVKKTKKTSAKKPKEYLKKKSLMPCKSKNKKMF